MAGAADATDVRAAEAGAVFGVGFAEGEAGFAVACPLGALP